MTGNQSILISKSILELINAFKAVGGILLLATGFRMIHVKMFLTADMLPAMILVMPCSWAWTTFIIPIVGA